MSKATQTLKKTSKSFMKIMPMMLAVVALVGLLKVYLTPEVLKILFNGSIIHDELIGIASGAISVGQPFLSYIIGGELLKEGVSHYAVTAFLLAYITLGVVQLPMQVEIFGMRFTLVLNFLAFIFSIVVSVATVLTLTFLGSIL